MWLSSGCKNEENNRKAISGSCSSPNSSIQTTPPSKKPMEEQLWRDISLSSLHQYPTTTAAAAASTTRSDAFHGLILQDFFGSRVPPSPTAAATAAVLDLNSGPDQAQYLESFNKDPESSQPQLQSEKSSLVSSFFHALNSSPTVVTSTLCKKRAPENEDHSCDGRIKRMIKNRESASRSRARKQAYTYELELEVARLKKENAKLRRQQEMLCFAAPAQLPNKDTLQRTLTAPF